MSRRSDFSLQESIIWWEIFRTILAVCKIYNFLQLQSTNCTVYFLSLIYFLSLAYDNLSGTLPLNFGVRLPKLKQLGFFGIELSGPIPDSISNASWLQILDLGFNNFVGQVPKSLGNLSDLWWLNLGGNHLGGNSSHDLAVLAYLGRCKKLEILGLDSYNFGGVLPDSIGDFSNQLGYLYLGQNSIHGRIPRALENLVNLFCLAMENNAIAGEIPENFGKFGKMQVLSLAGNRLSGKIPSSIGNLTQLFLLDLSRNSLNGNIPPSIKKVRTLQFLDLSHNNLSGEVPAQVLSLPFLSLMLNLSHNILTGNLPVEVGILKNLNTLDLSANNLSEEIPRTIGDCSSLESLYLQGNSFDEKIPSTLASLKGLVHLDLSRNNLTGQIRDNLLKLTFLLYLNLSFNHLEGEVPNKGIFQNASAVSVVGNAKLCGGATELQLPRCPIKKLEQRKSHGLRLTIIIVCVAALFLLCSFLYVLYRRRALQMTSLSAYSIGFLPKVSYKALYRATNGFSSSVLIGSGSFGTVYKGLLDNEENEVAIKVLNLQQKGAFKSFVRECNALKTIRHRNLVKILTCCSSMDYHGNEFKALVYEYMPNGSLDKWLHPVTANENQSRVGLNLIQRLDVAVDVSSALSYLHNHCEQPVIHCDLKPSNILLDNKMLAHINDFGLAQLMSPTESFSKSQTSTTGIKGTVGYAAPEYAMGVAPSRHGDVYSYGILVLEMFTGKRPTDEMFIGDLNLHNFVQMALPERLVQIVDSALLPREVEETNAEIGEIYGKSGGNQIDIDGTGINPDKMSIKLQKCLVSILEIGLACSVDSPKERMNMGDVTRELQHIRKAYTGVGIAN